MAKKRTLIFTITCHVPEAISDGRARKLVRACLDIGIQGRLVIGVHAP